MRLLLALLTLSVALPAQTITGLRIALDEDGNPDVTATCVRFEYTLAGVGSPSTLFFSSGPTDTHTQTLGNQTDADEDGTYYRFDCPVETPGAVWRYKIGVDGVADTDCPVTCTNCGSADDALFADDSGIDCPVVGQSFAVDHPAAEDPTPNPPVHADIDPYDDGAGGTVTETTPANLQADQTATADDGGVQVLDVDISGGNVLSLSARWDMTALSGGTTRQVIRPKRSWTLTPYVRTNFNLRDQMLVLRRADPKTGERIVADGAEILDVASNVTFLDAIIEDDPTPQEPHRFTLTGIASGEGTTTAVFNRSSSTCPSWIVQSGGWVNLPGVAYNPLVVITACTDTTITLQSGSAFTGSLSSDGSLTVGVLPISNVTTDSPIQVDFTGAHGLPCDGTPSGLDAIYIGRVNGQTAANGTYEFTCVDADSITLDDTTSAGTFTSSPYAFARFHTRARYVLVDADSTTGVHFGRSIVGNIGDGSYGARSSISAINASGFVFRDGAVLGTGLNCVVRPSTGLPACGLNMSTTTGSYFRIDGISDAYIGNNLLEGGAGIGINAQNFAEPPEDLEITGNHIVSTDRPWSDASGLGYFAGAQGLWPGDARHAIELKNGGYRVAITNNFIDGTGVPGTNAHMAILVADTSAAKGETTPRRMVDYDISGNYFRHVPTAVAFVTQTLPTPVGKDNRSFSRRVRIADNFAATNGWERRFSPQASGTAGAFTGGFGYQLAPRLTASGLDISHNAFFGPASGTSSGIAIALGGGRAAGCSVEDNIFHWHETATDSITAIGTVGFTPYTTTSALTRFDDWCPGGSFGDNVIIPGVEDPTLASDPTTQASTSDADTMTQTECESAWASTGSFAGRICAPGSSYADRHAAAWGADQVQEAAYADYGPDMAALRANVFREVSGVSVMQGEYGGAANGDDLRFAYTFAVAQACTVWISGDSWATATSGSGAAATSQAVTFTDLAPGSYDGLIACPDASLYSWGPKSLQ